MQEAPARPAEGTSVSGRLQFRERRASVRYLSTMDASCHPLAVQTVGPCSPVRIWDISLGGLSLVARKPFELNTTLTVVPESMPMSLFPGLDVSVAHVGPHGEGMWLIGCEFLKPITEEELESLLG